MIGHTTVDFCFPTIWFFIWFFFLLTLSQFREQKQQQTTERLLKFLLAALYLLLSVSSQFGCSSAVSLVCTSSMSLVQHFPEGHMLHLAFGLSFYPTPHALFCHWKSVWQVPGSIGLGAHSWKAWVYQPWVKTLSRGLALPKVEAPTSTKQCNMVLKHGVLIFLFFV